MTKLPLRRQRFVEEYLKDLNATQAAIRAGYSQKTARSVGHEVLTNPDVAEAIQNAMQARSERVGITQDDVLRMWIDVATADPNSLVEFRRGCCRYCYGAGHRFQRTAGEMERDRNRWVEKCAELKAKSKPLPPEFDEQGGVGFNPKREPNGQCPECFGDGEGRAFVKDTRALSRAARTLYAGVKETKEGLQVLMASQDKARELLGQHLGMLKSRHEHSGPDGAPIPHRHEMTDADLERIAAGSST